MSNSLADIQGFLVNMQNQLKMSVSQQLQMFFTPITQFTAGQNLSTY